MNGRGYRLIHRLPERFISKISSLLIVSLAMFKKKCDLCGKRIEGLPVHRYYRNFCSRDHVGEYFGSYVDETSDEVFWSDFY